MDLNEQILHLLDKKSPLGSVEISKTINKDHQAVVGALKSLQCFENVSKLHVVNVGTLARLKGLRNSLYRYPSQSLQASRDLLGKLFATI